MGAGPGQEMRPLLNIALATVRQIAHEPLRTVERKLPASSATFPLKAPAVGPAASTLC